MKFSIPFSFSDSEILRRRTRVFSKNKKKSGLQHYLDSADTGFEANQYRMICFKTTAVYFFISLVLSTSILFFLNIELFYAYGLGVAFLFSAFILFNQLNYPRIYNVKKSRDIDKNLIAAMQDMMVQLNSGVPIFKILVNLASSDYGEVSREFSKAVREINSGKPQIEAIESLGNRTSSLYFRRVLWQISNGMRSGSDMALVIKDNIDNLAKEQTIQIQSYGSKLNPLIMFYMLLTVIIPALALTFLTIIASMLNLPSLLVKGFFIAIFIGVVFMQIVFLGMIKTRRPSLL